MTRDFETASAELEDLLNELAEVEALADEEAVSRYNVDSKAEILRIFSEEVASLRKEVDYLTPAVLEPEYDY